MTFSVVTWNVRNPSIQRALRQGIWLCNQRADVFVLTECKRSKGCSFLARFFLPLYGYQVVFSEPERNEFGVIVASKNEISPTEFSEHINYLSARVMSVRLPKTLGGLEIVGVYAPSRGFDEKERLLKKKRFIEELHKALKTGRTSKRVFCGDFNVLEPNHFPHYEYFQEWEYDFYRNLSRFELTDAFRYLKPRVREHSWVGRSGNGYRYDHCFVSNDLLPMVRECYYIHQARHMGLSDHSALALELSLQ